MPSLQTEIIFKGTRKRVLAHWQALIDQKQPDESGIVLTKITLARNMHEFEKLTFSFKGNEYTFRFFFRLRNRGKKKFVWLVTKLPRLSNPVAKEFSELFEKKFPLGSELILPPELD